MHPLPTASFTAGVFTVGVICTPIDPISASPIMPEGFITHTDFIPSSD
jgi:hypothetical protein